MNQQEAINTAILLAKVALPMLSPNSQLTANLALSALAAVKGAQNGGRDVTKAELAALHADYAAAQAEGDAILAYQERERG